VYSVMEYRVSHWALGNLANFKGLRTNLPQVITTNGMKSTLRRHTNFYLTINLLTPWYRVLLEKLTGLQLVKKFPAFHGIRRFITALTSVPHLSLSWANPIQSIYPHPTSWRSILILSTHLRLGLPSVNTKDKVVPCSL